MALKAAFLCALNHIGNYTQHFPKALQPGILKTFPGIHCTLQHISEMLGSPLTARGLVTCLKCQTNNSAAKRPKCPTSNYNHIQIREKEQLKTAVRAIAAEDEKNPILDLQGLLTRIKKQNSQPKETSPSPRLPFCTSPSAPFTQSIC